MKPVHTLFHLPFIRFLFVNWLQGHLIPCPFKYFTGIDCPLCGFQRAVLALLQGQLRQSFLLYPPTIPVLLFAVYLLTGVFFKPDERRTLVKRVFFITLGVIIAVNYSLKLWTVYSH